VLIGGVVAGLLVIGGAALGLYYALKETPKLAEATKKEKEPPKPKEAPKAKEKELVLGPDGRMADEVREKVKASTVYIRTLYENKAAFGTGFFAAAPGLVVTNAHVVGGLDAKPEPIEEIQVITNSGLPDSHSYKATVLKVDKSLDLALLKVNIPAQPAPLEVIDAFTLKETQPVYIFGFPGGESIGTNISVNMSAVSSIRRDQFVSWIQIAGGMHKGNSGGPVTDVYGRVVGVARATIKDTQLNIAIPGDSVHNFFNNAGDLIPKK
jgi:S1-C subfamily serine protease